MKIIKIITVFLVIFAPAVLHANLLVNPSFEDLQLKPKKWKVFDTLPGWQSSIGSGIELQHNVAGSSHGGNQHIELASHNSSNMFQSVSTVAGQIYDLNFFYSPRPGKRSGNNAIEVWWDGELIDTLTASGQGLRNTAWQEVSYHLTATSNTSVLEFRDVSTGRKSYGGYLDDISLVANNGSVVGVAGPSIFMCVMLGFWLLRRQVKK